MMTNKIKAYVERNYEGLLQLIRELCGIPAPSHHEEKRAEYCKNWLEKNGAEGVYIDEALNVIYPLNCEGSRAITVIAAHTDTVFPDMEPLPFKEDEEKMYCPGVGDDTASVAVMLMTVKYFIENRVVPANGMLFVCNSCEEGLGNLKGTRQLMKDFEGRVKQFITLDSSLNTMYTKCVGSHRYRVEVKTEGGHSFGKFGNKNAIAELSQIISRIYEIQVPKVEDSKTTYNVGIVEGGTSVNTIAQNASMLCEYRSDSMECLNIMKQHFEEIFAGAMSEKVDVNVSLVGERPCAADVDQEKLEALASVYRTITEEVTGNEVSSRSASTDCNIPLSLGIPAICIGVFKGFGAHTREEWIDKGSLRPGLEVSVLMALTLST